MYQRTLQGKTALSNISNISNVISNISGASMTTSNAFTQTANAAKEKADSEAIDVFAKNLRQLLLAPPLGQRRILGLDPGFRTGCKFHQIGRQKIPTNGDLF